MTASACSRVEALDQHRDALAGGAYALSGGVAVDRRRRRDRKPGKALALRAQPAREDEARGDGKLGGEQARKHFGSIAEAVDSEDQRHTLAGCGIADHDLHVRGLAGAGISARAPGDRGHQNQPDQQRAEDSHREAE